MVVDVLEYESGLTLVEIFGGNLLHIWNPVVILYHTKTVQSVVEYCATTRLQRTIYEVVVL